MTSRLYRRAVLVFGLVAVGLGIAILVQTARAGGGSVGYAFGLLLLALGCARLYLLRRR
ncbi:MAG: hypothetical protein IRZ20_01995 [Thermoleophilia bacterium]|nr:hypothetical protein [Thermoleophilia bacterium]